MGLPARVIEVEAPRTRAPRRAPRKSSATARHARSFRLVCAGMIVAAVFGMCRVALAAKALEASAQTTELRSALETQQRLAGVLEAEGSSLATPSRIERLAGTAMAMEAAGDVRYVRLSQASARKTPKPSEAAAARSSGGLAGLLSAAMSMAAGEAQVLLVGDVALASSR